MSDFFIVCDYIRFNYFNYDMFRMCDCEEVFKIELG